MWPFQSLCVAYDASIKLVKVSSFGGKNLESKSCIAPLKKIVNVGSVGEPRHGRPNATYVIYDNETGEVNIREIPYDYQVTCEAIVNKGLPEIFAWRLANGLEYAEKADDPTHICER